MEVVVIFAPRSPAGPAIAFAPHPLHTGCRRRLLRNQLPHSNLCLNPVRLVGKIVAPCAATLEQKRHISRTRRIAPPGLYPSAIPRGMNAKKISKTTDSKMRTR
jgi:hypothetical protein